MIKTRTAVPVVLTAALGLAMPAAAQQPASACTTLKSLLQAAQANFVPPPSVVMPGAATCSVNGPTRSFGCIWEYKTAAATEDGFNKALHEANACFPGIKPKQSRSARGTLHTEFDFGRGQAFIDISRGANGAGQMGNWYSIDVVAP